MIALLRAVKRHATKNVIVICICMFLNFVALSGISNLQSSINAHDGLGAASLAILYGSFTLSALFTPTLSKLPVAH